jgi:hypothetical protein
MHHMAQHSEAARAAIRPVKEQVEDDLIARAGVVGVDIGEKITSGKNTGKLGIVVYVEKKKPASQVSKAQAIPAEIDGIPTDVQELTIELQPAYQRVEDVSLQVDTGTYSPLRGGISIGPARSVHLVPPDVPTAGDYVFSGTLGAIVKDRSSSAILALTNFHVACVDSGWHVGDVMVQPSRGDTGTTPANDFGTLTRATLSELVDGAVISLNAGKTSDGGVVDIGKVAGKAVATTGMAVQKRGRTTGHTFGSVASTDFTVSINYGDGLGVHVLKHQIRITPDTTRNPRFSDHGDSGSAVMDSSRNVVGLLFAGANDGSATFANPIQAALDELNVDLVVDSLTIVTRPIICGPLLSRVVQCPPISRTINCPPIVSRIVQCPPVVSKTILCPPLVTRTNLCVVSRSAICGPGLPGGPGDPGQFAPGPGSQYGADPVNDAMDDSYWTGYLAALEALAAEEQAAADEEN